SLDDHAFYNCRNLRNVILPESIYQIGDYAFSGCTSLNSVVMSNYDYYNKAFPSWDEYSSIFHYYYTISYITNGEGTVSGKRKTYGTDEFELIVTPENYYGIDSVIWDNGFRTVVLYPNDEGLYTMPDSDVAATLNVSISHSHTVVSDPAIAPDCIHIGLTEGSHCSICGEVIVPQYSVPATGHTPVIDPAVAATTAATGLTEGSHCSVCGEIIVAQSVIPTITTTNNTTTAPTPATPTQSTSANTPYSTGSGVSGFVERLYTVALGRSSDPVGQQQWVNTITSGQNTGADVARGFLYSPEFINKNCTNEEFVRILYRTFFGREADVNGLNAWVGVLYQGDSRQNVIEGFINSTEWANLCLSYGISSGGTGSPSVDVEPNQATVDFATRLYTTCLNRNADPSGLMAWARQLANQRETGTGAARGFFFSEEFIRQNISNEEYVARLYRTFMGREPDVIGFNAWVSQLYSGISREEVFNGFAQSQEFTQICAQYGIVRG
ncbi:MAG: DUF4214 domain-containing protein, partial [Clostridiales bacterium]|nr:DUF4214 domain-containing protein [Clostridiales bacterium]